MNRRTFGQLLAGVSALGMNNSLTAEAKLVRSDISAEIEREQRYLVSLQEWLSSSQSNPYAAVYIPGIKELIALSETRLKRLRSSMSE